MIRRNFYGKRKVGVWVSIIVNLTQQSVGSGGFMGDLVFNGGIGISKFKPLSSFLYVCGFLGKYGIWGGNQQ